MKKLLAIILVSFLGISAIAASLFFTPSEETSAANAKDFNPGRIIDDVVFYNNTSMSASQIQAFLNSKTPNCDTNGTGRATDWGRGDITRAKFAEGKRNGTIQPKDTGFHAPPYTCLKDFKQSTPQMGSDSAVNCSMIPAHNSRTAAQIIKDVADACKINPQVLIVLLEKEQSLVTDIWPLQRQYKSATGFACPDTAPCDPKYNGFFYQVYHAARQFNMYKTFPSSYNYRAGQTNRIYWHPDLSRCGSSEVFIENQATAALYIYTPYRPNQAAMNNLYGTGDSCSSYGNRNFWRIFTDWFGSTRGGITLSLIQFEQQPFVKSEVTATFTIRNTSKQSISLGQLNIVVRDSKGKNLDFPLSESVTIGAGKHYTYKQTSALDGSEGEYSFHIGRYHNGSWTNFIDYGISNSSRSNFKETLSVRPVVTSSLSITTDDNSSSLHAHQRARATFSIRNPGTIPVKIDNITAAGRNPDNKALDFPMSGAVIIQPGATYTYNESINLSVIGMYRHWISTQSPKYGWNSSLFSTQNPSISTSMTYSVKDTVTVTSPVVLTTSSSTPRIGDTITGTFTVRNFGDKAVTIGPIGLAGRTPNDKAYDMEMKRVTIAAGQSYTYTSTRKVTSVGEYRFWISSNRPGIGWDSTYPMSENSGVSRSQSLAAKDTLTVVSSLKLSSSIDSRVGGTIVGEFTVKNFGTENVTVGPIGIAGRDPDNRPSDMAMKSVTLTAGESYTYKASLQVQKAGEYKFWISSNRPGIGWDSSYPNSETSNISRSDSTSVKDTVTVTSPVVLTTSSSTPRIGDTITGTFTVRNFGDKAVTIGPIGLAGRTPNDKAYDMEMKRVTIAAGQSYTYTSTRKVTSVGEYRFWISSNRPGIGWDSTYPMSENSGVSRSATVKVN